MASNLESQLEEVESLGAIFCDDWAVESECSFRIRLIANDNGESERKQVDLVFQLPPDYPSASSPTVLLTLGNLGREEKSRLQDRLAQVCRINLGQNVLYQLIEATKEFLDNSNCPAGDSPREVEVEETATEEQSGENTKGIESSSASQLKIVSGDTLSDRKSVFQAHLAGVACREDVVEFVSTLKSNKKIAMATHNILAYRIVRPQDHLVVADSDDDGEFGAGSRLSHLLEIIGAKNVVVMVTRWYGGIHLGGDRFKHINNLARQLLQQEGFIEEKKPVVKASKKHN